MPQHAIANTQDAAVTTIMSATAKRSGLVPLLIHRLYNFWQQSGSSPQRWRLGLPQLSWPVDISACSTIPITHNALATSKGPEGRGCLPNKVNHIVFGRRLCSSRSSTIDTGRIVVLLVGFWHCITQNEHIHFKGCPTMLLRYC